MRHNKKLWRDAATFLLAGIATIVLTVTSQADCATPLGELLAGSDKTETANTIVATRDQNLVVIGARSVDANRRQGFAFETDLCGHLAWRLSLSPDGHSNLSAGLALADGGVLLGGSLFTPGDDATASAILMKLDDTGRRLWTKRFDGPLNYTVTNLLAREQEFLAVLQPYERVVDGKPTRKLKPDEERPVFLKLGPDGALVNQTIPLSEEKTKLFHIIQAPGSGRLLASGRFSYFGQPTRPAVWEIEPTATASTRLYSGNTVGLSFGAFENGPSSFTTLMWRSRLLPGTTGTPISLTRVQQGLPTELWGTPPDATATLPATALRARNGDYVMALQSFPRKGQNVTLAISRLSGGGKLIWQKELVRPFDSAITGITELADGRLVLAGTSSAPSTDDLDTWLVTLSADGASLGARKAHRW